MHAQSAAFTHFEQNNSDSLATPQQSFCHFKFSALHNWEYHVPDYSMINVHYMKASYITLTHRMTSNLKVNLLCYRN